MPGANKLIASANDPKIRAVFVVPVFDDWPSLTMLLTKLDELLDGHNVVVSVVAVNDAPATESVPGFDGEFLWRSIESVEVLHLTRNLGHQRAIAVGLSYVQARYEGDCVIVADADGEDQPTDMMRLIESYQRNPNAITVAERSKRTENLVFRIGYRIYKELFRFLTGRSVSFGNFCIIPWRRLINIVSMSEAWNNFPASLIQSRLPLVRMPTVRGTRYFGKSRMSLVSLVVHGVGSIAVFSDTVLIRTVIISILLFIGTMFAVAGVIFLKIIGHATPGWASNLAMSLTIFAIQAIMLSLIAAFLVLNNRTASTIIPRFAYRRFLAGSEKFSPAVVEPTINQPQRVQVGKAYAAASGRVRMHGT